MFRTGHSSIMPVRTPVEPASSDPLGFRDLPPVDHLLDEWDQALDLSLLGLGQAPVGAKVVEGFDHSGPVVGQAGVRRVGRQEQRKESEVSALAPEVDETCKRAIHRVLGLDRHGYIMATEARTVSTTRNRHFQGGRMFGVANSGITRFAVARGRRLHYTGVTPSLERRSVEEIVCPTSSSPTASST